MHTVVHETCKTHTTGTTHLLQAQRRGRNCDNQSINVLFREQAHIRDRQFNKTGETEETTKTTKTVKNIIHTIDTQMQIRKSA